MGPVPARNSRTAHVLLGGVLAFVATACGGAQDAPAPDCPVPTSATEEAPSSCEDEPGGFGY